MELTEFWHTLQAGQPHQALAAAVAVKQSRARSVQCQAMNKPGPKADTGFKFNPVYLAIIGKCGKKVNGDCSNGAAADGFLGLKKAATRGLVGFNSIGYLVELGSANAVGMMFP